jgi:hypothetical protein
MSLHLRYAITPTSSKSSYHWSLHRASFLKPSIWLMKEYGNNVSLTEEQTAVFPGNNVTAKRILYHFTKLHISHRTKHY